MGFGKVLKKATHSISHAVSHAVDIGKNVADSSLRSITDLARGNISGSLKNMGNVASMGTVDLTGRNRGILNVNTDKYIAKVMGADLGASGTGTLTALATVTNKQRKGLVGQLRQGKGIGGGSYTETVKNPLGGTVGKTGK